MSYPVIILGAGPVGLAAASHLIRQGEQPVLVEAGSAVGASVRSWGHVRFFSPWKYVIDQEARALLEPTGWVSPDLESWPTGFDILDSYLEPLARVPEVQASLRLSTRVVGVTRLHTDKVKTPGREESPFLVRVVNAEGIEEDLLARAVIDATGTFTNPSPLGATGLPARGEVALQAHIAGGIPDVYGRERARYAEKRVLVVGSGHSAQNVVLDLARLAAEAPSTQIVWAVRRKSSGQMFGGGVDDALPARGELGTRAQQLIQNGVLRFFTGVTIHELRQTPEGIVITGEEERIGAVDEIIVTTGFRPDLTFLRELRLDLDPALESPRVLAPLIDPNVHSCGTVPPHGVDELSHTETGFYIVGMKSYGRAPTFLLLTGYEQVRSVVAALRGDWESARNVELVLPETGVCSSGGSGGSCCAPAPTLLQVGRKGSC